jgi:hypothetical protein
MEGTRRALLIVGEKQTKKKIVKAQRKGFNSMVIMDLVASQE